MARRRRTRRHWPRAAASAVVIGSLVIIAMAQGIAAETGALRGGTQVLRGIAG